MSWLLLCWHHFNICTDVRLLGVSIDFSRSSLFIMCKQRIFCCFSFLVPFPHVPFVPESWGLFLEAFSWRLLGLPPLPPQSWLEMKNLWLYAHFIWSAASPSDAASTDGDCRLPSSFDRHFSSQQGGNLVESVGWRPWFLCSFTGIH